MNESEWYVAGVLLVIVIAVYERAIVAVLDLALGGWRG